MWELPNLTELNLTHNHFKMLPREIAKLRKSLQVLSLSMNQLFTLPSTFRKLGNLRVLDLSKNTFTQIPKYSLGNLEKYVLPFTLNP